MNHFHDYHAQELAILRDAGDVFSKRQAGANHNACSANSIIDEPLSERLLHGCAWLTARIKQQFDSYQLDWQEQMLRYLMPDALRPLPAMTIAHWQDPQRRLSETLTITAGTELKSAADPITTDQVWQTTQTMQLHPLSVSQCRYQTSDQYGAMIELELTLNPQATIDQLTGSELVFYLNAEPHLARQLYYLLLQPITRVVGYDEANVRKEFSGNPFAAHWANSHQQADSYLSSDAHQWLRWYFCFPQQFLWVRLTQLFNLFEASVSRQWRLQIHLPAICPLGQHIQQQTLLTHCVPIINLRRQTLDPIQLQTGKDSYLLPVNFEQDDLYQVTQVVGYRRPQQISIDIPLFHCLQPLDADAICYRLVCKTMEEGQRQYSLVMEGSQLTPLDYVVVTVLLCAKTTLECMTSLIGCQADGVGDLFQVQSLMRPSAFQAAVFPSQYISLLTQCLQHGQFNSDYLRREIQRCLQWVSPSDQQKLKALQTIQLETFHQLRQGVVQQGNLLHIELDERAFVDRAEIFLWGSVFHQFCQSLQPVDRLLKLKWTLLPSRQTMIWESYGA